MDTPFHRSRNAYREGATVMPRTLRQGRQSAVLPPCGHAATKGEKVIRTV